MSNFHINNNSNPFQFAQEDPAWSQNIKNYEHEKKNLQWNYNPLPCYIHHKEIFERDCNYNPILQKYTDLELEKSIAENEKNNLKRSLSQYYDDSLRYQQTFDIINLKDRFKGFENDPNYPRRKTIENKNNKLSRESPINSRSYNILSNKSLAQHNNIPYEDRPKDDSEFNTISPQIVNSANYRDYNIISNKYKENNDVKTKIDKEIEYLASAKLMNSRKDYDFIKNQYYNPEKEKEIKEKEQNKKRNQSTIPYRGQLYNPINMSVYDKENLEKKDKKHYNRINRYRIRPNLDDYYRRKDFERDVRQETINLNKLNYKRFEINDKRGYDLINMNDVYNKYKDNFYKYKNQLNSWEILRAGCGDNQTFDSKGLYKDPYDKADLDENSYRFRIQRQKELKELKPLEVLFSKKEPHKIKQREKRDNKEQIKDQLRDKAIDKVEWFKNNKSVDFSSFHPLIIK